MDADSQGKEQIKIWEFPKEGYKTLADFESWRVAALCFCEDLMLENIHTMQKHLETDEAFVLLRGNCTLFLGGDGQAPEGFLKVEMEPHRLYIIKKGVWHNHIMSKDGEVLIVENSNTSDDNSPTVALGRSWDLWAK